MVVPDIRQYTHDTGTHCGLEVACSMASSTPFTLLSTSLLTITTSKKCPYVARMASDSFWIICRFSIWEERHRKISSCWFLKSLDRIYRLRFSTWAAVLVGAMNTTRGAKSAVRKTFRVCIQTLNAEKKEDKIW